MHFTHILTVAALASAAMAGFSAHPTHGGKHVATGDKDSAKNPERRYVRDAAREHSGDHAVHHDPKNAHNARDAHEHYVDHEGKYEPKHDHDARDAREHREKGETHSVEKGDAHDREGKIERRNGGVYWCTKNNWKGTCTKVAADKKCRRWNSGAAQGSLGPDPGVTCHFYEGADCSGAVSPAHTYPGTGAVYFFQVGTGTFATDYAPEGWKCHS